MKDEERRKHVRRRPRDNTFVALRPDFTRLGKMVDISRGGLCFQYMSQEDPIIGEMPVDIDMFLSDYDYYIGNLPCKLVYEKSLDKRAAPPLGLNHRVCGLQFADLTENHIDQLELFLKDHIEEEEP